jgi:transposase-like protein
MRKEKKTDKLIDFVGVKRSEAERSEAEQSESPTKSALARQGDSFPNPEVRVHNGRRRFPSSYKAKILKEADACATQGELGSLLRQEGLYSSQLSNWRKEYEIGGMSALEDRKRGRKPVKNPLDDEVSRLNGELTRVKRKLQQAELIIEF